MSTPVPTDPTEPVAEAAAPDKRRRRRREKSEGVKVIERNQALHLVMRRTIGAAILTFFAAAIAVICALGIYGRPVPPVFLPVTENGTLLPLLPMNQPSMDRGAIGTFALEAVHALHTYDYINWRDQISAASVYFSPDGFENYQKNVLDSHTIEAVQARKMIVSLKPTGQITVPKAGINPNQVYIWQVDVPVEIDYVAHSLNAQGQPDGGSKQVGTISLFISRVPTTVNPRGVAIQLYRLKLTGPQA